MADLRLLLAGRPFPVDPPPQFVCPRCLWASWHPCDRRYGYCAHCKQHTGVPDPEARCTT